MGLRGELPGRSACGRAVANPCGSLRCVSYTFSSAVYLHCDNFVNLTVVWYLLIVLDRLLQPLAQSSYWQTLRKTYHCVCVGSRNVDAVREYVERLASAAQEFELREMCGDVLASIQSSDLAVSRKSKTR